MFIGSLSLFFFGRSVLLFIQMSFGLVVGVVLCLFVDLFYWRLHILVLSFSCCDSVDEMDDVLDSLCIIPSCRGDD